MGAVQAALDYCEAHPDSKDLVQGPLVLDDGKGLWTHWGQPKPPGLWGTWQTDPRGKGSEPFEIPMMGLGLWMMRKDAWPGFNPLFNGFGGEEGYTHEVVRQRGGKCYCLPALRWRHKFRDVSGWHNNPAPPYPLRLEDHVWNLLVGHRELGIDALPQIFEHFGTRLPAGTWEQLVAASAKVQPFGGPRPSVKRQKILAVWYSDNHAPLNLTMHSLSTVVAASKQALRHDVTVSACSWDNRNFSILPGMGPPVINSRYAGERRRGYDTIVNQIKQAVAEATKNGEHYDAVAFCEHDVLYPPNYFDRVGDALATHPAVPVVSNLDYIGLNGTGWQAVKERHEPLHQLTLRWDTFVRNLLRAEEQAKTGQPVILEPDHGGERKSWVRLPVSKSDVQMPSVHVNHQQGRFTSHGEVCYEPRGYSLNHPHWGEAKAWWPGPMTTVANVDTKHFKGETGMGCSSCEANKHASLDKWFAAAAATPSDFHEHVPTLKELAAKCEHVTELSAWQKPADVALAAGLGEKGRFTSVCRQSKPQWKSLGKYLGERFKGIKAEAAAVELEETDLLFIDTEHDAEILHALLEKHAPKVRKYLVVHCTVTFGQTGDQADASGNAKPGVMKGLVDFVAKHMEWGVIRHDANNHGLMVLSRLEEDRKAVPGWFKQAGNFITAMAKHAKAGSPMVSLPVFEKRMAECAVCPERSFDKCGACGCPLAKKLQFATESCGLVKKGLPPKWGPVTEPADLQ